MALFNSTLSQVDILRFFSLKYGYFLIFKYHDIFIVYILYHTLVYILYHIP